MFCASSVILIGHVTKTRNEDCRRNNSWCSPTGMVEITVTVDEVIGNGSNAGWDKPAEPLMPGAQFEAQTIITDNPMASSFPGGLSNGMIMLDRPGKSALGDDEVNAALLGKQFIFGLSPTKHWATLWHVPISEWAKKVLSAGADGRSCPQYSPPDAAQ
jgi:hypothetical protein